MVVFTTKSCLIHTRGTNGYLKKMGEPRWE
jgi:hypothetical protein